MKIVKEALKALGKKPVTSKFPLEQPEIPEGYRGKILYEKKKCISCFTCVKFCPSPAIFPTKEKKVRFDMGRCIFCGRCQEVCPVKCIHLTKKFDMATNDRESLWVE